MDLAHRGPDDVLAQATRARLFSLLAEAGRPLPTEDLAESLSMHPNGIRAHLDRLADAGLLVRERETGARGRPRTLWYIAPSAAPGGSPPRAYALLARWLARATPATPERLAEVEETGREIGREVPVAPGAPAAQALADVFTGLGFNPAVEGAGPGVVHCTLGNCPYRDAVEENREVICTLHRGIAEGVASRIQDGASVTAFTPKDPFTAGCEMRIEGLPAD